MATTKYTSESVQCYPVDMKLLNEVVNKYFHGQCKTPDNVTYSIIGKHALVRKPIQAIINEEYIGGEITKEVTWFIFEEEAHTDGSKSFTCMPTQEYTITLSELEGFLCEPVSLASFTKDRRGYNSRICGNEREWEDAFNKEAA